MPKPRYVALFLLAAAALCALVYSQPPTPPPKLVLLPSTAAWPNKGPIPERWIPRNWGWMYRICRLARGNPRTVQLNIEFAKRTETLDSLAKANGLGPPLAQSNGVAIWFVPKGELRHEPSAGMWWSSNPRMTLSDGGEGTILSGAEAARFLAHFRARTVDFFASAWVTNGVQTNFFAAARAQLPYGMSLLFVDARQADLATNRTEVLIGVNEVDALGRIVAH